ncbi:MAG: hypothetical protein AAFP70_17655, partial [Calditrichota bacterium]
MRSFWMLCLLVVMGLPLAAQDFANAYQRHQFLMGNSTSFQEGLLGFANPANAAQLQRFSGRFNWSTDGDDVLSFRDWGLYTGANGLGFSAQSQRLGQFAVRDYQLALASGNNAYSAGIGYS